MFQKVQKHIKELNMIVPKDTIMVALSGGADSVALLLMLDALKEEMQFSIEAIHVEHGIRGEESLADADFAEELCRKLRVPCHRVSVDVPSFASEQGLGIEESARRLRYQVFSDLAQKKQAKVAVAHHMEDNAETILFQMIRGSALAGMSGISPMRTDENGVTYIRPLLCVHRYEIEEFLEGCAQTYRIDSTNAQLDYSRNLLRKMVLPQLEKVNVNAVEHICEGAEYLSLMKDFLDAETEKYWQKIIVERDGSISFDSERLLECHSIIQKEIIYRGITYVLGAKKDISSVHVDAVLQLCKGQSGKEISLPQTLIAKKEFERVYLFLKTEKIDDRKNPSLEVSQMQLKEMFDTGNVMELWLTEEEEKLMIRVFPRDGKTAEIPKKSYTKWLDYDKIKTGFCVRNRSKGDYFICDKDGHHKKLKQYFIDEKISSDKRESMWLLAQENLVLWLVGGRISEHLKVTDATETIVEIEYKGGNKHEC